MKISSWRWLVLVTAAYISARGNRGCSPKRRRRRNPRRSAIRRRDRLRRSRSTPSTGGSSRWTVPTTGPTWPTSCDLPTSRAANLTIERVRVLDPSRGGRMVDELSGDKLASRIVVFGGTPNKQFGPGVSGLLFMDVTYPVGARLPERLEYRFDVSTSEPTGLANSFRAGPTRVSGEEPAQIGSPLFGKRWLTGEGCCDSLTSHRGAIFPIDGTFYAPERFAIDWVQVGKNGRLYDGPKDKLSSYTYYGAKYARWPMDAWSGRATTSRSRNPASSRPVLP